ncbi:MAG: S8 family serine peptidase [Gammaproteobacteria bacterium]|nr:S8 family serine peptidase [Gammaproteobacteria bacterium]
MKHRFVYASVLALAVLFLVNVPIVAKESADEQSLRILVTFHGASDGNSANSPIPGRSYRYRTRYRISAIVRKDAKALAHEYEMTPVDDWPIESLNVYCVVYEPRKTESLKSLLQELNDDPRVDSAQEMYDYQSMVLPTERYNDAYAGFQYGLESMNVSEAHQFADGSGVKIAVIDSSVDLQHEDFLGSRIQSHDFVPTGRGPMSAAHGTAVVSLIVANPNNDKGIVGVAPAAELVALRACWSFDDTETARCNSFTLAKALDFLIQSPPDLINLSIAGPRDPLVGKLIEKALQNGTVIVAARPLSVDAEHAYPAGYAGVLAVSAAASSNESTAVAIAPAGTILAPGEHIMVALPDDGYDFRSGSSLAAANASGVIALLLERVPDLDGASIADILRKSQIGNGGSGEVINACRALAETGVASACQLTN